MRKFYPLLLAGILGVCVLIYSLVISNLNNTADSTKNELLEDEEEGYDGPALRDSLEFEKTKDPELGYVPYPRLFDAINYTRELKENQSQQRIDQALLWQERGPIFDTVGPSNGNTRAGVNYTAGRIRGVLVDTLNDPSGNTVFCGGVAGGLWRCTNFLSEIPNWVALDDYMSNLAVSAICQDRSNPAIMYMATGEATSNADAVLGKGVWKSINAGLTWNLLPSTANFIRNHRVLCDNSGNVYVAARTTAAPAVQTSGLLRSSDGGLTWQNITPTAQGTATATATCTDIEISSTGKLHASFGYLGTVVRHYFTTSPSTVTQAAGWTQGTGIRTSSVAAVRMELAALADTLYAVTINTAYNADSCYKSVDGGTTWTKQNTTVIPSGLGSGQGWYNLTLTINPNNSNELLSGGLDAYRSTNAGANWTRATFWVTTAPYVHADHHFMQWWYKNGESRILIGNDGGLFLTRDNGATWKDKNRNLAIKQFYAGAIHPAAGSPYLLAGAQDNGTHQLKYPGLGPSIEVTGGDGCFVHINQQNPQIQFGSYVYNMYRRSTNGGQTWASVNLTGASQGMFVNPWDYDDAKNILYGCWAANTIVRWPNANTSSTFNTLAFTGLGTPSSFKVSPHTADRVFIGSNTGKLYRLDHADVATPASFATDLVDISGSSFPAGFMNCINVGTSDTTLVAVFTNYGVNNVWYSNNGGTSWTAIDGNLPDMPVRWALFEPGRDDRLFLATETGIFSTDLVNGASTVWIPNTTYPTVRTDMIKMRTSDSTIVAATHGRGLFTAKIPAVVVPAINFVQPSIEVTERTSVTDACRGYTDYIVGVGLANPAIGDATVTLNVQAGNSATPGVDFDFTTNGNFTTPSNQLVFTTGATGVKQVTIRIYDDAEVEGIETFSLGIGISGTTSAVPGPSATHTVTINDNDIAPRVYAATDHTIGTYNGDVIATSPFQGNRAKHRLQTLFYANELRAAGITATASLQSLTLKVITKNSTQPFNGFTISMANSTATTLSTGFQAATFTQVYSANYSSVVGDNVFNFTTAFTWDGVSNVLVQFCFDNTGGTPDPAADVLEGNSAPLGIGVRASTYSNFTTSPAAGCALAAAFVSDFRVNAIFKALFGNPVATALNTTKTEYLNSNNDLYFYSPTGQIIARVKNLSGHNYGCTQVVIDRAGTGSSQFWNNNPANYLMNKTFRIIPTTNNPAGRHEVTFYYTAAEKTGWETATGQSWNNIQLVKLPSRISNVTPLNAQPDGPGTVQVVTPVRGTYGADHTLTYTFDNGFSGYGAGIPGRMNTLITLTGTVQTSGSILLNWTTSAEINSTQYTVEKSYDGVNFHTIATIQSNGNSLAPLNYNFTDNEKVQVNYYRVRLLHSDSYVALSNTILLLNNFAPQDLYVLTNPFSNEIRIRLGRVPEAPFYLSLYDMGGKLVKRFRINPSTNFVMYNINADNILSRAIYVLDAYVDGRHYKARVLKL